MCVRFSSWPKACIRNCLSKRATYHGGWPIVGQPPFICGRRIHVYQSLSDGLRSKSRGKSSFNMRFAVCIDANLLSQGDETAISLGVDVRRVKQATIIVDWSEPTTQKSMPAESACTARCTAVTTELSKLRIAAASGHTPRRESRMLCLQRFASIFRPSAKRLMKFGRNRQKRSCSGNAVWISETLRRNLQSSNRGKISSRRRRSKP